MEVVILAGGIGRRFGGEKQFASVAHDGATLLEVTLRDARRTGCGRAVIVTAPGSEDTVRSLFTARPVRGLDVVVVTQRGDDLPAPAPCDRDKPWGTAHALWTARDAVTGPFLLFNADDYYGPDAPSTLATALASSKSGNGSHPTFALLGYPLGTTLSPEGTVSRAVCEVDDTGRLAALCEYPAVDGDGRIVDGPEAGDSLPLDALVSMNAWAFTPEVFALLEDFLREFVAEEASTTAECYLPAAINAAVRKSEVTVRVARTTDRWCGLTWLEDRARVTRRLAEAAAPLRIAARFGLDMDDSAARPFGDGLIHTTWRVDTTQGPHILQRLNAEVFADPVAVAENAAAAAARINDALRRRGDEDPRRRLVYLVDADDRPWIRDDDGAVWRAAVMIPGSRPVDSACAAEVRAAARLLGRFPGLVAEGSGPEPQTALPGFHDTASYLTILRREAEGDVRGRCAACRRDLERLLELSSLATRLPAHDQPLRFVHNDAKLDNVLVDEITGEALCAVDLDTVQPGLAAHDFGDLVRSAVTGRPEDEPELALITVHEATFLDLATGYLSGAAEWIEPAERALLVDGALVITYEQALRFLADHLTGDRYYPVDDAEHNLRRARAQLRLLSVMLATEQDLRRCLEGI